MRRMLWITGAFFAVVITVGLFSEPPDRPAPSPPAGVSQTDHAVLQRDSEMTQRMGVPGAPGGMERGAVVDDQLRHSQSEGFVADLEAHQADIDRMLARPGR
jgi:hypothetical protein